MNLESLQGRAIFGKTTRIRPLQLGPHAGTYRIESHRLERPDGAVLEGRSSRPLDDRVDTVVLYFGGRNENVVWAPDMASFNPRHAIYAFNYRGFGRSTGRASESRAKADAQAIHEFVAARESMADLAIVGRSLGTAVALWLAREARPRRLVLMSPFESVAAVLRTRRLGWLAAPLVTQRFDGVELAAGYEGRTLVLLAGTDTSVPHAHSRRLCARLPEAPELHVIGGVTHQSLPRSPGAQAAIARFLSSGSPVAGRSSRPSAAA
ncbi:alpha/beta hydrolase [Scleromatobacter humisilvae]|uniref:Alpha/beta hydrolase n=1 Tax=Scleromatobacter humisilvae TaxID=2897159 RepID=A0A9X2BXH4_9BURK|nr:alpha/beta fold hydrolase [Scleromatobacter humisilvae]MCK9684422.1 alpha/beta hydrolase [Scleromatobacter humisilvae]